jgi:hypothetical protein
MATVLSVTFRNTLVQVILVCGARGHEVPFWKKESMSMSDRYGLVEVG